MHIRISRSDIAPLCNSVILYYLCAKMILDITRHKFFEGLATLLLFAVVTTMATWVAYMPTEPEALTTMPPIGALVSHVAAQHATLSAVAMFPIIVYAVLRLARATARAKIYPQSTLGAIALGAATLMALLPSTEYATLSIVALLTCEAFGRLLYCFGPNIRAHYLFTAMLALGALPLVDGTFVPLAGAVVLLTIALRGTLRETIIALVGALLPAITSCYIEWLTMGSFTTPLAAIRESLLTSSYMSITDYITLPRLIFLGVLATLALLSVVQYFTNRVTLSTSARNVWFILLMATVTIIITMLLGHISTGIIVAMAVISVPMLPMLFICTTPFISVATYILFLLAAAIALA